MRGYTRPNLFRMRQFYEAYRADEIVSALLRQLPWAHHLLILGQAKSTEERHFYLRTAIGARCSLEFLNLADGHSENDLHRALLQNLGHFITELSRDFCFVGSEYPIQALHNG